MLLGFNGKNLELGKQVEDQLKNSGYNVLNKSEEQNSTLNIDAEKHFCLSNISLTICLSDKLSKYGYYLLGTIRSIQVPTILLTQNRIHQPEKWIPIEFCQQIIPKGDQKKAFSIIDLQVDLYEEDFVIVDDEKKWETYITSLSDNQSHDGKYDNVIRDQITNNINMMGDIFNNITGNVTNKSTGNIIQSLGEVSIDNSFIQDKFGKEFSEALIKVAEIISHSNNTEAKELFDAMKSELKKDSPKKSILQTLWSSIVSSIPLIDSSISIISSIIQNLT